MKWGFGEWAFVILSILFVSIYWLRTYLGLEWGSIADWIVGFGLLAFASIEIYIHYTHNKKELIRPHIARIVKTILPGAQDTLTSNKNNAQGMNLSFYTKDGTFETYWPKSIFTTHDDIVLLTQHASVLIKSIKKYAQLVKSASVEFERFVRQIYPKLAESIKKS